ncbi:SDR family NAD(P)-dependent oxidoreductase [Streptomyces vinaceus]|uniref:SDR family NAD(P)-dependent oxidoreductase n=1 Tax=Streptomyces vinaceus TaxID=1960 RepID=UPI0036ABD57F
MATGLAWTAKAGFTAAALTLLGIASPHPEAPEHRPRGTGMDPQVFVGAALRGLMPAALTGGVVHTPRCPFYAAYVELATLAEATPEHFDATFDTNARGTFFTVRKALPLLNDGGSVVLVASIAHSIGAPVYTAYSAAKAATRSFARSWAAELKDRGIRVNSVSPGSIDTPIFEAQAGKGADALRQQMRGLIPLNRLGRPEEVAAAVLFLAGDDAGFITGVDLEVDGGQSQI